MTWDIPSDLERFFTFLSDDEIADALYVIVSTAVSGSESESQDDASSQLLRQILELIERAPITDVVSTPAPTPTPAPIVTSMGRAVEEIDLASIIDDFMK